MKRLLLVFFVLSISCIYYVLCASNNSNSTKGVSTAVVVPADVSSWMDSELRKAKRKSLLTTEQFFTRDSAKLVGYIKGYQPSLGFRTMTIDAGNLLSREERPLTFEIDASGKFSCTFPMIHPRKVTLSFDKEFFSVYLEPGQVLAICFDWNDIKKSNGFEMANNPSDILYIKGPLAKLNYELLSFKLKTIGYRHYSIKTTHQPEQYLAVMDSIIKLNEMLVKQAVKDGKISSKAIAIQKNEALLKHGFYLIDYAIAKNDEGVKLPANYYNSLQKIPLNDPTTVASGFYSAFINRFEENPVTMKRFKNLGKWNSMGDFYMKVQNNRDSLLKTDLKLSTSFNYDVTKIRRLAVDIKNLGKNEAYAYYGKIASGIQHPFLKQEGLRIMKSQFGTENTLATDRGVSTPALPDKPLPQWVPLSLPANKEAELFSKLIAPYKGKYLFVDFWGTSCGPCRWGIEDKKSVRDKYKDNAKFEFVFITCNTWSPNMAAYEKYVVDQGLVNSYYVSNDDFNYFQQLFRFRGVPHYLFIDPNGKVLDLDFEMYLGFERARQWIEKK